MSKDNEIFIVSDENVITTEPLPESMNLDLVRNLVHEKEHPHPISMILIAIVVVLITYILYIIFIKRDISGYWYGKLGSHPNMVLYNIRHNRFTDKIVVNIKNLPGNTIPMIRRYNGYILGNAIYLSSPSGETFSGILTAPQVITWTNSDIWHANQSLI